MVNESIISIGPFPTSFSMLLLVHVDAPTCAYTSMHDAYLKQYLYSVSIVPPIIANITTEGTARVGQPYTLVCSVLSGLEGLNALVISYQWTKDNGTRSHLGANSNTLSFPSLRLSDAGSYTCEIMVNSSHLLKQTIIRAATQVKVSSKCSLKIVCIASMFIV